MENYMQQALELAHAAAERGEVPVGCVIVHDGKIIGRGANAREHGKSALLHAEIIAIEQACCALGDWRLNDCTLYVTLEPCPMCAGAIINARIPTVVYGASDTVFGACGGVLNLFEEAFGFHPKLYGGVLAEQSSALLKDFFASVRQ